MESCIRSGRYPSALYAVAAFALLVTLGVPLATCANESGLTRDALVACTTDRTSASVRAEAPLNLRAAVAAALIANPDLVVVACETRVREARMAQADLLPNPEVRVDVENVAGSGSRRDDEQAETTVVLSQLFELGGKRGQRVREAGLARDLALWDYEARRLSVVSKTIKAFVATLAVQERVSIAYARSQLAETTVRGVRAQVDAGAAPSVDLARAQVAAGRAQVAHGRTLRDLIMARRALAAAWGSQSPRFARVEGTLGSLEGLPPVDDGAATIARNPDVARWQTEQAHRATGLAVAELQRIPDVTIGAGGRYFSDNGDGALVVQLSVPLAVFDWGQGAVGVARRRLARAEAEQHAIERTVAVALAVARDRFGAARQEATLLRERLLPEARRAVAAAEKAFRRGLIGFTDLLATELTAFELREEEVLALEATHVAAVDVARLTGTLPVSTGEGATE